MNQTMQHHWTSIYGSSSIERLALALHGGSLHLIGDILSADISQRIAATLL